MLLPWLCCRIVWWPSLPYPVHRVRSLSYVKRRGRRGKGGIEKQQDFFSDDLYYLCRAGVGTLQVLSLAHTPRQRGGGKMHSKAVTYSVLTGVSCVLPGRLSIEYVIYVLFVCLPALLHLQNYGTVCTCHFCLPQKQGGTSRIPDHQYGSNFFSLPNTRCAFEQPFAPHFHLQPAK